MKLFKSKIDTWIALVLYSSIAISLAAAIHTLLDFITIEKIVVALFIFSIGAALPFWGIISTRYIIKGDILVVQSGPFKWNIIISSISEIKETKDILSSPALSLDRLLITYENGKQIMISPKNRSEFLELIQDKQNMKIE